MRRREVIAGIASAASAGWPLAPRAQPAGKIYRLGVLEAIPAASNMANLEGLRRGLRNRGYVEGRNLVIEYRSADGNPERFADLAADLARLKVDIIVTRGTPATVAAKHATETIPLVMATMGAPGSIVASFARPGGNVTGVTTFSTELSAKRIEILKELAPGLSRVALLHNLGNPAVPPEWEETKRAARLLGIDAELLDVRKQDDVGAAFELATRRHVDAIVVGADGLIQANQQTIIEFAARNRLPAVYPAREFVEAGGLVAYAINYPDMYYSLATFIDKILRGEKPSELPVEQPTRFELVINGTTAKRLGLQLAPTLLARADEVIE